MKDLSNSKIWIGNDPELSEKVQKRLFELGYKWISGKTTVQYKNEKKGLLIEKKEFSRLSTKEEFDNNNTTEIFLSDLFDKEWTPKVGEIWRYDNRENYIINSFHNNGTQVSITSINSNDTIKNYLVDYFKNKWIKISSNQEEDLSKVPYTEWRVGDTITPFKNWDDNGGLTADKEYVITKFSEGGPYMIKNDGYEDWSRHTCFKLIKRASQDTIKDDFVLSETWYVTITEENQLVISYWKKHSVLLDIGCVVGMYSGNKTKPSLEWNKIPTKEFGKEITTEQFYKYILKQSIPNNLTNNNLNKQENGSSSEKSINSEGITKSVSRISGTNSTREELRGLNYGFEKSYRRQRVGITEVGSRRR